MEQMTMDVTGLSGSEPLWARLEVRAEDAGRDSSLPFGRGNITESGISLNSLIAILSRPPPPQQVRYAVDAGPVTLDALRGHRR
jgi:hypothetical protein